MGEEDEEPEQVTKLKIAMMRMQDELEKKVQGLLETVAELQKSSQTNGAAASKVESENVSSERLDMLNKLAPPLGLESLSKHTATQQAK